MVRIELDIDLDTLVRLKSLEEYSIVVKRYLVFVAVLILLVFSFAGISYSIGVYRYTPKVKHVVVIIQENHSFDNYFALFPNANGIKNYPDYARKLAHPLSYIDHDLCHSHSCMLKYYDKGKMDGWTDYESFGYFNSTYLSYYYRLASNYTLLDNYFSDFMGPTLPNRLYSVAGSNYGITEAFQGHPEYYKSLNQKTIFDIMEQKHISWATYVPCMLCNMNPLAAFIKDYKNVFDTYQFFSDLKSGNLRDFSMIGLPDYANEHPVADVRDGMREVSTIINAIQKSSYWSSTVILVTWDESGGFYDHVAPPNATYGFRVPMIIVSPFAKHGFVYHKFASHSSILKFTERVFGLGCLNRDCNSNDLFDTIQSNTCYTQNNYITRSRMDAQKLPIHCNL